MHGEARSDGGDRGISPVVGIAMLIAVTLVLSAVIATFVLSLNTSADGPADADLSWAGYGGESGYFNLSHTGGESLDVEQYTIEVEMTGSAGTATFDLRTALIGGGGRMRPGDVAQIGVDGSKPIGTNPKVAVPASDVVAVRLIWHSPSSDRTQLVTNWAP